MRISSLLPLGLLLFCALSTAVAAEHSFQVTWSVDDPGEVGLAGFRIYDLEKHKICETNDPNARSLRCTVGSSEPKATYYLVSFSDENIESEPSAPFSITFADQSPLKAVIHWHNDQGSLAVTFDGRNSGGDVRQYRWNFNDGSAPSLLPSVRHTFPAPGTYKVALTVVGPKGQSNSATMDVVLTGTHQVNQPPKADLQITSPVAGAAPFLVTFDAQGSHDPEGGSLSFFWQFGDGTTASGSAKTSHRYLQPGTYTAMLTVTDTQGDSTTLTSQPILVAEAAENDGTSTPEAVIELDRDAPIAPATIRVDGRRSRPGRPDGTIVDWAWDFGDGTIGTGDHLKHVYPDPGTYTLRLTVTDDLGRQDTVSGIITVRSAGAVNPNPSLMQIYDLLIE